MISLSRMRSAQQSLIAWRPHLYFLCPIRPDRSSRRKWSTSARVPSRRQRRDRATTRRSMTCLWTPAPSLPTDGQSCSSASSRVLPVARTAGQMRRTRLFRLCHRTRTTASFTLIRGGPVDAALCRGRCILSACQAYVGATSGGPARCACNVRSAKSQPRDAPQLPFQPEVRLHCIVSAYVIPIRRYLSV